MPPATGLQQLRELIRDHADPDKAKFLTRFFRTGPGEYAAGDKMLGIPVPAQRKIALSYSTLPLTQIQELLQSPYHEERLISLLIATHHFEKALKSKDLTGAQDVVRLYLKNTARINNWDLVDLSAYKILGRWLYLQNKGYKILEKLAHSPNLWKKRIAMVSTYYYIKQRELTPTLQIATILLHDRHDLIHKAVGWMLREVGKISRPDLDRFLAEHYRRMPRTTLRYAIEKHPPATRQKYLLGKME